MAVAEHTFALLLGLLRQVPRCDAGMRGGKWEQGAILGREVQGRTFGIVGMGAIGRCVASIAQGFGGRVTGFDPYWPEAFAAERNIERRDLDTLLRESDFVCVHCPLTPQTENLIGTRELGLMKPSSVLVNMARGGIVDESALYDALTARHIGGAVLDAFSQEPPSSMPFAALPNVLLSPHVGAFTEEALEKMSRIAVDQVFQFLDGERPMHMNVRVMSDRRTKIGGGGGPPSGEGFLLPPPNSPLSPSQDFRPYRISVHRFTCRQRTIKVMAKGKTSTMCLTQDDATPAHSAFSRRNN